MKAIRLMSVECGRRGGISIRNSLYLSINSPISFISFTCERFDWFERNSINQTHLKRRQKSVLRISVHWVPIARMHIRSNYMTRRSVQTLINYTTARGGIWLDSPQSTSPFVDLRERPNKANWGYAHQLPTTRKRYPSSVHMRCVIKQMR